LFNIIFQFMPTLFAFMEFCEVFLL